MFGLVPNRKSAEEKLYFHTKMNFGVGISSFQLVCGFKVHLLFFHLLAVRPAQTHPGPYGPGCVVLLIEVDSTTPGVPPGVVEKFTSFYFAFQAVRPEMHTHLRP